MISIGDQVRVVDLSSNVPYYLWGELATVIDSTSSVGESACQYVVCFDCSETHFALHSDLEIVTENEED